MIQQEIAKEEPIDLENKTLEEQLRPLKAENFNLSKEVERETMATKQTHDQIGIHESTTIQVRQLNDNMSNDIMARDGQIHQTDINLLEVSHKCGSTETAIKDTGLEFENVERENRALLDSVKQLQGLRNDELAKLEIATFEFNKTKNELEGQKRLLMRMNMKERLGLGIKIFQNSIEGCTYKRKLNTFNEIRLYSKFDKKCHTCLRKLANNWYKQGKFIKMKALD